MDRRVNDRPMRVLTVLDHGSLGGGTLVAASLLRSWRASGVEAKSVSLSWTDGSVSEELGAGDHRALDRASHLTKVLALRQALATTPAPVDVVFTIGEYSGVVAVLARRLLPRRRRPAIVVAEHQPALLEDLVTRGMPSAVVPLVRRALRAARGAVDGWVGLTETEIAQRRAAGLVPAERSTVIPNPLLVAAADEQVIVARLARLAERKEAGPIRLITIGAVNEGKNHLLLLEVLARLGDRFQLSVVGEGDHDRLLAQAVALGVASQVELLGARRDITDLLDAADLFVLSSDYESFGLVLIEAIARGMPIVATDCGPAIGPLAALSPAFRVVPIGDATLMAEQILSLCSAELRSGDLRAGARAVVAQHEAGAAARAHLALFAEVLRHTRRALDAV